MFVDGFGATTTMQRTHGRAAPGERVASRGAARALPPYSPDLNPIELAISEVKAVMRSLARRSVDGVMSGIAEALESITPQDILHYIAHRGYLPR